MEKEKLKRIIVENRKYINDEVGGIIKRDYLHIPEKLKKEVVLYGVRRSGKTFALYDIMKANAGNSLYMDFEDERLKGFDSSDFEKLKESFDELYPATLGKKRYFFFDEIQNVEGWERYARRAVEKENTRIFAAGSSSRITPSEIHTSLRGREWTVRVTPLSFKEYVRLKGIEPDKEHIYGAKKAVIKKHFSEYMKWGGFPEVSVLDSDFEKRKVLREYMSAMFFRDLVEKYGMTNTNLLDLLIEKLFSSFSCKLSLTAFYRQYKDKIAFSKDTLFGYYQNILKSLLVYNVRIFAESTYKRNRNPAKIYLTDPGLARRVTSEDKGRMLENIVFMSLTRGSDEIFYFSGRGECDFVAENEKGYFPYQVCYELNDDNSEREINGLVECCTRLNKKEGLILSHDQEKDLRRQKINIRIIPVWKWLLSEDEVRN